MVQQEKPKRRTYHWPGEARVMVASYLRSHQELDDAAEPRPTVKTLVSDIAALTGHPREVCLRFVRQLGVHEKRAYSEWTRVEQQRLLDLITLNPPHEAAKLLNRSPGSVYRMLNRLGASAQMGREWFTVYTLAQVLHINAGEVQRWIENGWLQFRVVETGGLKKKIIDADKFAEFCKKYRSVVVGRRLSLDRLEFVRTFVFPPSHTGLLQIRERGYKCKDADNRTEEDVGGEGIHENRPGLLECSD
jgi:hypothetical protein